MNLTEPVVARSSPAAMRRSVVLPQPLGPMTAVRPPAGIENETSFSARTPPEKIRETL